MCQSVSDTDQAGRSHVSTFNLLSLQVHALRRTVFAARQFEHSHETAHGIVKIFRPCAKPQELQVLRVRRMWENPDVAVGVQNALVPSHGTEAASVLRLRRPVHYRFAPEVSHLRASQQPGGTVAQVHGMREKIPEPRLAEAAHAVPQEQGLVRLSRMLEADDQFVGTEGTHPTDSRRWCEEEKEKPQEESKIIHLRRMWENPNVTAGL